MLIALKNSIHVFITGEDDVSTCQEEHGGERHGRKRRDGERERRKKGNRRR